jgi:hypothetical protein
MRSVGRCSYSLYRICSKVSVLCAHFLACDSLPREEERNRNIQAALDRYKQVTAALALCSGPYLIPDLLHIPLLSLVLPTGA